MPPRRAQSATPRAASWLASIFGRREVARTLQSATGVTRAGGERAWAKARQQEVMEKEGRSARPMTRRQARGVLEEEEEEQAEVRAESSHLRSVARRSQPRTRSTWMSEGARCPSGSAGSAPDPPPPCPRRPQGPSHRGPLGGPTGLRLGPMDRRPQPRRPRTTGRRSPRTTGRRRPDTTGAHMAGLPEGASQQLRMGRDHNWRCRHQEDIMALTPPMVLLPKAGRPTMEGRPVVLLLVDTMHRRADRWWPWCGGHSRLAFVAQSPIGGHERLALRVVAAFLAHSRPWSMSAH
mmetsp:Transcript_84837/g.216086  ORF Transcript_84837/g.216086 Transcript_84837/m.216086 type:complete len:293 (+) Transcript_84837:1557-2435(+)